MLLPSLFFSLSLSICRLPTERTEGAWGGDTQRGSVREVYVQRAQADLHEALLSGAAVPTVQADSHAGRMLSAV